MKWLVVTIVLMLLLAVASVASAQDDAEEEKPMGQPTVEPIVIEEMGEGESAIDSLIKLFTDAQKYGLMYASVLEVTVAAYMTKLVKSDSKYAKYITDDVRTAVLVIAVGLYAYLLAFVGEVNVLGHIDMVADAPKWLMSFMNAIAIGGMAAFVGHRELDYIMAGLGYLKKFFHLVEQPE